MSKKNRNPNRQGFLNYCRTIAGIEKDKDVFCKSARMPRGGADIFGNLDRIILDLNSRLANHSIWSNEYTAALDRIRAIIAEQNAHELKMAEILANSHKT